MYAKIINNETKQCDVGIGTNIEFYKSIGMTEMEVEQAYNGSWYVKGFAPEKPLPTNEEQRQNREAAYTAEVDKLHSQKLRRTIMETWTEEDEANYIAEVKRLSEEINNRFPYYENIAAHGE